MNIFKLVVLMLIGIVPVAAEAIVAPHDATNDIDCVQCHTADYQSPTEKAYNERVCIGCHKAGGIGAKYRFAPGHAANPFGTYTGEPPGDWIQVSHTWYGKLNVPQAGAVPPLTTTMNKATVAGALSCAICHNIHAPRSSATNSAPSLRMLNERDEMCLDCHRPWKVVSHLSGNHPVNFNYTGASSKVRLRSGEYYNPPRNAREDNPTAAMKLKKGGVVCSTCHGLHFTDSNSATFDNGTSAMVRKQGMLLRTDLRGEKADDINICSGCHKGKAAHNRKGQNVQCADCHSAHVGDRTPGGPNVFLVRRFVNISTQYGAVRGKTLYFRYTGAARNYSGANGACVTCHTIPEGPEEHASATEAATCNNCHSHNNKDGSFTARCDMCHGFPPTENTAGGPKGFAAGYDGIGGYLNEALSPHRRHAGGGAGEYAFRCEDCHKQKSHITIPRSYQDVFPAKPASIAGAAAAYDPATRQCSSTYCHSNGVPIGRSIEYRTPTWSASGPLSCTACHDGAVDSTALSTRHRKHVVPSAYGYDCETCHSATASGSAAIKDRALHVNNAKDVSLKGGGTYDAATRACSATFCHSGGSADTPPRVTPEWDGPLPADCTGCHGGNITSAAPMTSGLHGVHVAGGGAACGGCHADTVEAGDDRAIRHPSKKHLDGETTVALGDGSWAPGSKTCTNVSCHPSSYRNATWGETACLSCHAVSVGSRAAIAPQFSGSSHHIQGQVTNDKCYHCHWEADSEGKINRAYHSGSSSPGAPVDLVVYGAGFRPSSYSLMSTAVQYKYTSGVNRSGAEKITNHCLGCHRDANNSITPFGDGKTPRRYAWDGYSTGSSISARYASTASTRWGKYSTATGANKRVTKALSAHGNAVTNVRGWSATTGVDGTIPDTGALHNVQCYDCHNSHGSAAQGITSRYSSATGRNRGGILKTTEAGKGGYSMAYSPSAGGSAEKKNRRNPGASICLDCHLNSTPTDTPWGYDVTFGATQPIAGYWDNLGYKSYTSSGSRKRYSFKGIKGKTFMGGHFGAYSSLSSEPAARIDGLCTPCHDPHGISPKLGDKQQFAVPLLKGTWVTSPYREDTAPAANVLLTSRSDIGKEGVPYRIDQNTFGSKIGSGEVTGLAFNNVSTAAGLCIDCHTKSSLTAPGPNPWKSKNRIHETVQGWKTTDAVVKHSYTCSKCHTPHTNSTLPRLMVTNCLDSRHKGRTGYSVGLLAGSGEGYRYADKPSGWYCRDTARDNNFCGARGGVAITGSGSGSFPGGWKGFYPYSSNALGPAFSGKLTDVTFSCHETETGSTVDQSWNVVTPWVEYPPIEITSGPALTGSGCSLNFTWTTNVPGTSRVDYGYTTSYGSTLTGPSGVTTHTVPIAGCAPLQYYYKVTTVSVDGKQQITRTGVHDAGLPTVQTFSLPASSSSLTIPVTAFTGADFLGITGYKITTDSMKPIAVDGGWSDTAPATITVPSFGTYTFYPWVRDVGNNVSAVWGSPRTVVVADTLPPTSPANVSPANGVSGVAGSIALSCTTATDAYHSPVEYRFQVALDSGFTNIVKESAWLRTTTYTPGLSGGATYYWRVKARDAAPTPNETAYTAPWSLTTAFNSAVWTSEADFRSGSTAFANITGAGTSGRVTTLFRSMASGRSHILTVKADGTVWGWGDNLNGQLGLSGVTLKTSPAQVAGVANAAAVAAGSTHSLALLHGGTVRAWGDNWYGQLGDGTTTMRLTPITVGGLSGVISVAAGSNYSVALKSDGTVWSWGINNYGQLGNNSTTTSFTPVQATGLANVVAIAAGPTHALAVREDGTVWAWGENSYGKVGSTPNNKVPYQVPGLTGVIAVAVGEYHSLALKSDGTVWGWGRDFDGELGIGSITDLERLASHYTPVQATGLTDVVSIAAGYRHSLAVTADGSAWAWGANTSHQVAAEATPWNSLPRKVDGVTDVVGVAGGQGHSVAVTKWGTVHTWGGNSSGQNGNGIGLIRGAPVAVANISGVSAVAAKQYRSFAIVGGEVWAWGAELLGTGSQASSPAPVKVPGISGVTAVATSNNHSLARTSDGTVKAWGRNWDGQLGDGTTLEKVEPAQVPNLSNVAAVAAGQTFSLALHGTGSVSAWGLINGTSSNTPYTVTGLSNVAAIAAGNNHALALTLTGDVYAWGTNYMGEIGNSTLNNQASPVKVPGVSSITAIAAGTSLSLGLTSTGTVWAWGGNSNGQLGNNSFVNRSLSPVQVSNLSGVDAIAASGGRAMALVDGAVWVWGREVVYDAATDTLADSRVPVQVPGITGATAIAAGTDHFLVLLSGGEVRAWGKTGSGQVGDGTDAYSRQPVEASIAGVVPPPASVTGLKFNAGSEKTWGRIYWTATTPGAASVRLRTRGAANATDLATATWSDYYTTSGSAVSTPASQWLEVDLYLNASGNLNPVVDDIAVTY